MFVITFNSNAQSQPAENGKNSALEAGEAFALPLQESARRSSRNGLGGLAKAGKTFAPELPMSVTVGATSALSCKPLLIRLVSRVAKQLNQL